MLTTPALGQEGPTLDGAKAESSAEKLIRENAELAKLDRLVADLYAAALELARDSRFWVKIGASSPEIARAAQARSAR